MAVKDWRLRVSDKWRSRKRHTYTHPMQEVEGWGMSLLRQGNGEVHTVRVRLYTDTQLLVLEMSPEMAAKLTKDISKTLQENGVGFTVRR